MPELNPTIPVDVEWIDGGDSSLIKRYGYSPERTALVIEFTTTGAVWQYAGPAALDQFRGMLTAESIGKRFYSHIKDNAQLQPTYLEGT